MNKRTLKQYAKLIVKVGVNLQKGQDAIIRASFDQVELVTYVVEECYKRGAREVTIDWNQAPEIRKIKVKYESLETLGSLYDWEVEKLKHRVKMNPAMIYILSEDPDEAKGIDQEKLAKAKMMTYPTIKPFIQQMDNQYQWTIVGAASPAWAKKVFPDMPVKKAVEKLWEAILHTSRLDSNFEENWKKHNESLLNHCNYLNSLDLDYLEYKSSNGTDFRVALMKEGNFLGGGENSLRGIYYNPNMPTEECFTTPIKGKAEGVVVATKPLSYNGELITDMVFTFKDGKVVEAKASNNEELLKQMLAMDEGASYLGECALVPFESPVNETGILFYNTLYDENAVCHLALGRGFSECIKDYSKYTQEDYTKMGVNESMIHVDFMIGSRDLSIVGYSRDGKKHEIFKNGTWAF